MLTERQVLSHPVFSEFLMQTKAIVDAKAQHDTQPKTDSPIPTLVQDFIRYLPVQIRNPLFSKSM